MNVVNYTSIDDLFSELREEATRVVDKIVRLQVARVPEQVEEISFEVGVWITALIKLDDDSYLLEFGASAGCDDTSAKTHTGSECAAHTKQRLSELCDDVGLKLRPGKIEVY
jgi:hypothetical protein